MALDFDINSALAGAKTAFELATAPEDKAMQRRIQEEQLATSQQARATSEFELQKSKTDFENKQAILKGNEELAKFEGLKKQSIDLAADKSKPIDIRRKGTFNILQKGHIAVLENNPETVGRNVVDEGNKLASEYGALVTAMQNNGGTITTETDAQVKDMVNRAAKYSANFQTEYDKNTFWGSLRTDGEIYVYAKDKNGKDVHVDTYKNAHELATTIAQDNKVLDAVTDTIKTSLAKYGDQTWKEIESKNKYLTNVQTLADSMPTEALKQQVSIFSNLKEEAFNQAVPELLKQRAAYFNTKSGIESRALVEPFIKDIRKKISKIKNGSDQVRYLNSIDIDELVSADVQRQIAEKGGDVRAVLSKELFGDKSLYERVEKGGELLTKEREARAKEIAASSKEGSSSKNLAIEKMKQEDYKIYQTALQKYEEKKANNDFLGAMTEKKAVDSAREMFKRKHNIDPENYTSTAIPNTAANKWDADINLDAIYTMLKQNQK